jgi:hypothetical protein
MYPLGKSTEAHVPKAFFVNSLMCRVRNYEEWHEEYAAIFNRMQYHYMICITEEWYVKALLFQVRQLAFHQSFRGLTLVLTRDC